VSTLIREQEQAIDRLAAKHGSVAVKLGYADGAARVTARSGRHWHVSPDGIVRDAGVNFSIDWSKA